MNIKEHIIELLNQFDNGKYSNIVLNEYFSKNYFKSGERGFVTEVFYGIIRNNRYIEYQIKTRTKEIKKSWIKNILKISLYQLTFMNTDSKGVIWEATELAKCRYGITMSRFVNGVLRKYLREKDKDIEELRENNRLDILFSYPKWFYKKLNNRYGDKTEEVLKAYKQRPYLSVRVNLLKYTNSEFKQLLKKMKIDILKKLDTVYYINSGEILYTQEFLDGKFIIQDGASYLAGKILNPEKGEIVADVCSAPGSKTCVLAECMQNSGEIIALDIHNHKLKLIKSNLEKLDVHNVKEVCLDARELNSLNIMFDKILADVPCSGFGVLRKKPEVIYNKNLKNIEELANLQLEILNKITKSLKVQGTIVYSTCTIFDEENINNIRSFLKSNPNFSIVKIDIPDNISGYYDSLGGFQIDYKEKYLDNFYIIKLRKDYELC